MIFLNQTALHIAAKMGNKAMVDILINHGAKLKKVDNNDEIPLFIAIRSSNSEVIDILLRGFDITTTNRKRQSALHLACMNGSTEIARKLIDSRVDINGRDIKGNSPMHYATMCDCAEIVNVLLNHKADPTIRNAKGKSPFFYASVEIAKIFRQYFQAGGALDTLSSSAKRQSSLSALSPPSPAPRITYHRKGAKNRTQPLTPQKRHIAQYENSSEVPPPLRDSMETTDLERTKNATRKINRPQASQFQSSQEYITREDFDKYRSEMRLELDELYQKMNRMMSDLKREILESHVSGPIPSKKIIE
ncbi:hypothetical protein M9Y10_002616 [Tritrichomonas musculus]|uniref:Ankyrin repeat protein n=1 Tax=Tritrichomonas musculus TaxID=1915356 RepID=A0ABR2LAC4_9EUKA